MTERCKECREYLWSFDPPHRCKPKWEVQESYRANGEFDEDDYTYTVFASGEQDAGELWADASDSGGDYTFVGGHEATVRIRKHGSEDEWKIFTVTGEAVPEYRATEKKT